MKLYIALLFVISFFIFTQAYEPINESYRGYKVIRYHLLNESSVALAKSIVQEIESAPIQIFDVWSATYFVGGALDISIPPQYVSEMKRIPLPQTVMHEDLLASIEMERKSTANSTADPFFNAYRNLLEYDDFLDYLVDMNEKIATRFIVGTSSQRLPIWGIRITGNEGPTLKRKIILNGAQHAREWISCTTVAYFAWYLMENYVKVDAVNRLVNTFEFHLIPISNPDGYSYSWSTESNTRMWRKNRQTNSGSTCIGVDNNRNWDYYWNNGGISTNPCSDTFLGPYPFSTPESKALGDYISQWKNQPYDCVIYYNDVHSYSQLLMSPWGYTITEPRDYAFQKRVMEVGVPALFEAYRTVYQYGPVFSTIYQASGAAVDFGYGDRGGAARGGAGIINSFTIELRDTGEYGFVLPPIQIDPQGIEFCNFMVATATFLLNFECE